MTLSTRIGGVFLLLACIALPIIIVDYVMVMSGFDGGADPSNAQRAEFAQGAYSALAKGWKVEILAVSLIAAASLIFLNRPSRAGWSVAAVGALITIPMYGIMLGGYGEIFNQPEPNADLYVVLRSMTIPFFYVGQGLMMGGLGLALFQEAMSTGRVLPSWLLMIGGSACAIGGLTFLLLDFGLLDGFMIGAPFALVGFILTALLGARIAGNPA